MDFELSEDQVLLQESVHRFMQDNYSFEQRRKLVDTDQGFSDKHWSQFAELGWLAMPFSEDVGGYGGTPVETMVVLEEFGKGLMAEPYISTVVLGGGALVHGGTTAQQQEYLAQVGEGKLKLALGFAERQSRYNLADVEVKAEKTGGDYVLNGMKSVVFGAPSADKFIISARTGGSSREEGGISLFMVDASADGVSVRGYPTVDGMRAGEVTLDGVKVAGANLLGAEGEGFAALDATIDFAIAATAAEAVGAMSTLNDMTLEYIKTREQFGQPIGKFQVLQHRMVDMFIAHEEAKSMAMMAAMRVDDDDANERRKAASATKVQIAKSSRFVGQQSIQLHGGIGMTDEYAAGHYFKRLTMIDRSYGDGDFHLARFGALS